MGGGGRDGMDERQKEDRDEDGKSADRGSSFSRRWRPET
jgi:hypothetical protein